MKSEWTSKLKLKYITKVIDLLFVNFSPQLYTKLKFQLMHKNFKYKYINYPTIQF